MQPVKRIIISRTDAIGDVVLTLPLAGLLKARLGEDIRIIFLGRSYTYPVIACCSHVDEFLNYDAFSVLSSAGKKNFLADAKSDAIIHVFPRKDIASAAYHASIPFRIGTSHRYFHWLQCNRLVHFGRKNSPLHESQLNVLLIKGLGLDHTPPPLKEISSLYGFKKIPALPPALSSLHDPEKFNLILHPRSHAHAREWNSRHYHELIRLLPPERFRIFITGSASEKEKLAGWISGLPVPVTDLTGKLTLEELISFISHCDGLVAASTGPLHIAAAAGIHALGIFPPLRPMHPGRWAPLGRRAGFLCADKKCSACRNQPSACSCMDEVSPQSVYALVNSWKKIN